MEKPVVVTRHDLTNPTGPQTSGINRGEAFAHPGVWAGVAAFPGGAATGWHHHGGYATYAYITAGGMTVEYGRGGHDLVNVGPGDFVYIPAHLVHRESVSPEGGEGVVLRVGGQGALVINVDGPEPEERSPSRVDDVAE